MIDWKDEIRRTIYRQIPRENADTLDFEDSVQLHKQSEKSSLPIWERTADAVRKELLSAEQKRREEMLYGSDTRLPAEKSADDRAVSTADDEETTERLVKSPAQSPAEPVNSADVTARTAQTDLKGEAAVTGPSETDEKTDLQQAANTLSDYDAQQKAKREATAADRMNEARAFLFKENMRLEGLRTELSKASKMMQQQADVLKAEEELLQAQKERFEKEKEEFRTEMKELNEQIRQSRQKLTDDQTLFDKKYKVLEMGFAKLNADKKDFEAQKRAFEYRKKFLAEAERFDPSDFSASMGDEEFFFFKGVSHPLAVKKRYKELIKIYHPDNSDGDKYILQRINWEYDRIRRYQK